MVAIIWETLKDDWTLTMSYHKDSNLMGVRCDLGIGTLKISVGDYTV